MTSRIVVVIGLLLVLALGDEQGTLISGVPAGRWTLRVFTPNADCRTVELAVDVSTSAITVARLELLPGLTVRGEVLDAYTAEPVYGVRVSTTIPLCSCATPHLDVCWPKVPGGYEYTPPVGHPQLCPETGCVVSAVISDAQGRVLFEGLDAATVRCALRYYGRELGTRSLHAGPDDNRLEVDGRPSVTLELHGVGGVKSLDVDVDGERCGDVEGLGYHPRWPAAPAQIFALDPGRHVIWAHGWTSEEPSRSVGALLTLTTLKGRPIQRGLPLKPLGCVGFSLVDAASGEGIAEGRVSLRWNGDVIARAHTWHPGNRVVLAVPFDVPIDAEITADGYRPHLLRVTPAAADGPDVVIRLVPE